MKSLVYIRSPKKNKAIYIIDFKKIGPLNKLRFIYIRPKIIQAPPKKLEPYIY